MKELKTLFIALIGFMIVLSCSDDNNVNESADFAIEKSDVAFDAEGGTGEITVSGVPIASVSSSDEWCSVQLDGDHAVKVTVARNNNYDSRSSVVSLSDAHANTRNIAVSQQGMKHIVSLKSLRFRNADSTVVVAMMEQPNSVSVNTSESEAWLTAAANGNELDISVTKNETGKPRIGYVCCDIDTIRVVQCDTKDIFGDYYIVGDKDANALLTITDENKKIGYDKNVVKMTLSEGSSVGKLTGQIPDYNVTFAIDYDEQTLELKFQDRMTLGNYTWTVHSNVFGNFPATSPISFVSVNTSSVVNYNIAAYGNYDPYSVQYDAINFLAFLDKREGKCVWKFAGDDNRNFLGFTIFNAYEMYGFGNLSNLLALFIHPYMISANDFTPASGIK